MKISTHNRELIYNIIMKIAEDHIDEAFSLYGAQKLFVSEHLGITIEELEMLCDYLGIDGEVWED